MSLKKNVIANFLGNGYVVILQFALVPFLLKYLGTEAYGLVGIYMTLLAALNMLDMGLSPALSRELARLSAIPNAHNLMRITVTTLESIYFAIAILIVLAFFFISPWLVHHWLNNNTLPSETVITCLRLIGAQCALQFMTNFYTNGLNGLQHMVRANYVLSLNHTLRAFFGLLVLIQMSANVEFYFLSQLIMTFVGLLLTAHALYKKLPSLNPQANKKINFEDRIKARFSMERLDACKRFATGMAITSVLTFFIMQTDKIIVSKLVSLEEFGYYTVAVSIAVTIAGAAGLVSKSVLPRMTQLIAINDIETTKSLYLKASSLVAWIILPISGLLIIFKYEFLTLYLGDPKSVEFISPVFALLMTGYAIHSLMYIPYSFSLAHGWTRYGINTSIVAIIIMTPVTIYTTLKYGIYGAAASWTILSIGYLCFSLRYLHSRFYKELAIKVYKIIGLQLIIFVLCIFISFFNQ